MIFRNEIEAVSKCFPLKAGFRVHRKKVTLNVDIAAKRHPGEIDSVFHRAGKTRKKNILYIGISNSYGRKKHNFGLFTRPSTLTTGILKDD